MSTDAQAAEGGDRPADGSRSRPSKNNRQGYSKPPEPVEPGDLPGGTGLRPVSVEPGRRLRDEAVLEVSDGPQARPWYSVVEAWRDWYADYLGSHIEFEGPEGETVRTALENSYMPDYGKRYYAKLKDFERGVSREFDGMTTVMLTLSASNLNAEGHKRCPADHMRDIADGWDTARKQLHQVLSGRNWEYARVWEPHESGYGHQHVAVFVEDPNGTISREQFGPVMKSYVEACKPAGWEAHRPSGTPCSEHETAVSECSDCKTPVSVNDEVNNLGSYISEYIGIFGEEALNRPMKEQMFNAVAWATGTRRVEFSNGAQDMMRREQFRRETGLRPSDRGGETMEKWEETGDIDGDDDGPEWAANAIVEVAAFGGSRERHNPGGGGARTTAIDGSPGTDPPADRGGPPPT